MRLFTLIICSVFLNSCYYGEIAVVDTRGNPLNAVQIAPSDMFRGEKYSRTNENGKVMLTLDIDRYQLSKNGYATIEARRSDINWPTYTLKTIELE